VQCKYTLARGAGMISLKGSRARFITQNLLRVLVAPQLDVTHRKVEIIL